MKVFSVLWHESPGSAAHGTDASFIAGQFGEPVYSYIRRMVVVKEFDNTAQCLYVYRGPRSETVH